MGYDFDTVIERKGTNSLKYDFAPERGMPEGLLPMWVADMDFAAAPEVLEDLHKAVTHGIFGYTETKQDYYDALSAWFSSRFHYAFEKRDVVKTPGVVFALAMAVRSFTKPGESVLIQTPVYYPFFEVIRDNDRIVAENPLVYSEGTYKIDFEDFERNIKENAVKLFLLCSPHNPVGRVWSAAELTRIGEICGKYGVLVVSDEIHCDFVWEGFRHTCYGTLSENCIVATAPSKTFNIAGLQVANIIIKNPKIRQRFKDEINKSGYSQLNTMGLAACRSAYTHGEKWLAALKEYLQGNIALVDSFLKEHIPNVHNVPLQGTYLLWLDFKAYDLPQRVLDEKIVDEAHLWLDGGTMFGRGGEGFQRMNIACPRATLLSALEQLERVFTRKP
jgi:cystathionine beta-lyase